MSIKTAKKFYRILTVIALILTTPAQMALAQGQGALIIRNDPGGRIDTRGVEVEKLRAEGRRVELRGEVCLSACTMYLGLDNVCVDHRTQFGFHGPSTYGRPMPPEYFEYWSQVLASHYLPPLSNWFMTTARYSLVELHTLPGTELIRLGYKDCDA